LRPSDCEAGALNTRPRFGLHCIIWTLGILYLSCDISTSSFPFIAGNIDLKMLLLTV
jgi:hypothetical protein